MSGSKNKFSKFLVYISGAIGLGILGAHLYNKKIKKDKQLNSLDKHIMTKELKTLFKAEYTFIDILLNEDSDTLINNNIESVFELNAIQYALDIYHESRNFKTLEIKNLIRVWLLNNIKLVEGYLRKIDEEEVNKSINRLERLSLKLRKTIKDAGMHDSLAEDLEIQEYIIGTYVEINKGVEKNLPIARYIYNLNN